MKHLKFIIIGLFVLQGCVKETRPKIMTLISTSYDNPCAHLAFRITEDKVEIDNCYKTDSSTFKAKRTISLNNEPILKKLYETSTKDLKKYQRDIDTVACDFTIPIIINIKDGKKYTVVEWKGITNCYPESVKETVEELIKTFERYK